MTIDELTRINGPQNSEHSLLIDAKQECLRQIADGKAEPWEMAHLAIAYRALVEAEKL
jgi:hypothetical protein